MNVPDSKDYLEKQLKNVTVTVIENYKGQPNNRYEFSRPGIKPAAILLAQKLPVTSAMLDDIAVAVNKKLDESPVVLPEDEPVTEEKTAEEPEMKAEAREFLAKQPSSAEFALYRAAKNLVAEFEKSYPMT